MFIDFSNKDHGDYFHGGGIGHAEAVEEVGLDVKAGKPVVDLGATTVDKDDAEADAGEENKVPDDRRLEGLGFHGGASVLDYNCFAPEFLDKRQGFRVDVNSELGWDR